MTQHELDTSALVAELLLFSDFTMKKEDIYLISEAAKYHDVGKIFIPDSILLKPSKLTNKEFDIMKKHTIFGSDMISKMQIDSRLKCYTIEICRHHHERIDGKGYPDGLIGKEIPFWVQIVSIADVYEALTSERCYKPAYTKKQALEMLKNGDCGRFDSDILEQCMQYIRLQ